MEKKRSPLIVFLWNTYGRNFRHHPPFWVLKALIISTFFFQLSNDALGQDPSMELKGLSLEELMNIEVVSVSKKSEKLSETPSAIQVVTGEEVLKFGATNIPEALSLAGNLQVAQKGASSWGISARGFNTDLANKLLVLMDGRTVYTPLYSGVFWERQDYLLEDIDQIEVISGPGSTLWGANAVNGVINITSKSAEETQGLFLEGAAGNELKAQGGLRYGGKIAPNVYYRVYGRYSAHDGSIYPDSSAVKNSWKMAQGGYRMDAQLSQKDHFTLQGDIYSNQHEKVAGDAPEVIGGNILGRWSRTFADSSSLKFQAYYDRTNLYIPTEPFIINNIEFGPAGTFKDDLTTIDFDLQHRFSLGNFNQFIWGLGYRFTHDEVTNSPALGFLPTRLNQDLFSVFVQDEFRIFNDLSLTVGSKLEHNDYSGFVLEPSARLGWNMAKDRIVWAAVSRAVRAPSRIDRDVTQGTPPYFVILQGNNDFRSETVVSIEGGIRSQIGQKVATSLSLYYNQYDHIRSTVLNPETIFPLTFENGLEGDTYGFEVTFRYEVVKWWQLFACYNLLEENIKIKEGKTDFNNAYNETADPGSQLSLRSSFALPYRISINPAFRWVDDLPINNAGVLATVPAYGELDTRIEWEATPNLEVSVSGRNLLNNYHVEYGVPGPTQEAIERSIYGRLIVRI